MLYGLIFSQSFQIQNSRGTMWTKKLNITFKSNCKGLHIMSGEILILTLLNYCN